MGRGRPKGSGKKDPFKDLPDEFKDNVESKNAQDLKLDVAKISLDQVALDNAMEADEDLAAAKEAAKVAGEVYKDGAKQNKLKIKYIRRILKDRGESSPESLQEN